MIKVRISCHKQQIVELQIAGHAMFDEHGRDLVCAGVSSIGIGALNALDILYPGRCQLELLENTIKICVIEQGEGLQTLLKTVKIQLETMEEQFPRNIKITRKEV